MRPLIPVFLIPVFLAAFLSSGCLLIQIRPVGDPVLKKSDLPDVGQVDGDPVRTFLRPDAIPAIDEPVFVPASEADFMAEDEAVLGVVIDGVARAYSVWHLDRHEIVNDKIGEKAFAVTW